MTPKQKALDAAHKAYLLAAKRNDGPTATVAAIVEAYEKAHGPRKTQRPSTSELWANMPSFVRVITKNVCERRDVEIDWLLADSAPLGQRYAVADARSEICRSLYGRAYGKGHISYTMLGQWFGRDHTTIMHAVKKPERLSVKLERLSVKPECLPRSIPTAEEAIAAIIRRRALRRASYKRQQEARRARIKAPRMEAAE